MIAGHFATALVAKAEAPAGSIWLYLVAAMSLDFLMSGLVLFGVEKLDLGQGWMPAMGSAEVDMRYSHDLVPVAVWALAGGLLAFLISRNLVVSYWCAGLVIFHELCDLVSGYPHNVFGPESMPVGLQLWITQPVLATFIEALLALLCVLWFMSRYQLKKPEVAGLVVLLVFSPVLILPSLYL